MRSLVSLVVSCLLLASAYAQLSWQTCGETDFSLSSLSINPAAPVVGQSVDLAAVVNFAAPVTAGKAVVTVKYGLIPLPQQVIDLCSNDAHVSCPLSGTMTINQVIPGDSALPAGRYTGKVTLINQDNVQFGCYTFAFNINKPLNAAQVPLIDEEIIKVVNKEAAWKAVRYPEFENLSLEDGRRLLSLHMNEADLKALPVATVDAPFTAPTSFDSRNQWPGCIHPIRNQGQCGSCWAFGSSESLSDRFCIASKGAVNVVLSPQYQVSCDKSNMGCNGGQLPLAWNFLASTGTVSESCWPYQSMNGVSPGCRSTCLDGSSMKFYKARNVRSLPGEANMQNAIMAGGPIEGAFNVYQDFYNYHSGVYSHTSGAYVGGHAIKVVGWGVDSGSGQNYWIIANSWGTSWGMNGYFWMRRGVNMCNIESYAVVGDAAV